MQAIEDDLNQEPLFVPPQSKDVGTMQERELKRQALYRKYLHMLREGEAEEKT